MARDGLLVDADILIDYLKGVGPARALLDSAQFTFYYEELLSRYHLVPVDDAVADKWRDSRSVGGPTP